MKITDRIPVFADPQQAHAAPPLVAGRKTLLRLSGISTSRSPLTTGIGEPLPLSGTGHEPPPMPALTFGTGAPANAADPNATILDEDILYGA